MLESATISRAFCINMLSDCISRIEVSKFFRIVVSIRIHSFPLKYFRESLEKELVNKGVTIKNTSNVMIFEQEKKSHILKYN